MRIIPFRSTGEARAKSPKCALRGLFRAKFGERKALAKSAVLMDFFMDRYG
jgi:hypothetical protein